MFRRNTHDTPKPTPDVSFEAISHDEAEAMTPSRLAEENRILRETNARLQADNQRLLNSVSTARSVEKSLVKSTAAFATANEALANEVDRLRAEITRLQSGQPATVSEGLSEETSSAGVVADEITEMAERAERGGDLPAFKIAPEEDLRVPKD